MCYNNNVDRRLVMKKVMMHGNEWNIVTESELSVFLVSTKKLGEAWYVRGLHKEQMQNLDNAGFWQAGFNTRKAAYHCANTWATYY